MEKLKNKKGITLVALVITIIVLIVLAGISISIVLGPEGLIEKARVGTQKYNEEATKELGELEKVNTFIESFGAGGTGNLPQIKKQEPLIPKMTSSTYPSGIASASSYWESNDAYAPWKAFNGTAQEYEDAWVADWSTENEWIQYQFPSAVCVNKITITNRNRNQEYAMSPKNMEFKASNDGSDWVTLANLLNENGLSLAEYSFDIENNNMYLYYRVFIKDTCGDSDVAVGIGEIQMYGYSNE